MKLPAINISVFTQIFIFCVFVLATGADGNDTTNRWTEFNSSMATIKDGLRRLQDDELNTSYSIELIISGDPDTAHLGYKRAIETIKTRINLENQIQEEIQYASQLHATVADSFTTDWNRKMHLVANDLEADLSKAIDDLDKKANEFSKVLNTERLDIFDHMSQDKIVMLEAIKNQHVNASQFETSFFSQLETMVDLSKSVDKTQLLFLEFVVNCLDLKQERMEIEKAMATMDMTNYLDILEGQSIDAGNISSTLDFTFARLLETSVPELPPPPHDSKGFHIEITPDRGVGGIYHARTHEKIRFTLKASHDCWFILRYRDTMGEEKQLCPNERYSGGNFLKAGIPLVIPDDLPYDFFAQKPYGIDALELIASPQRIEYMHGKDKFALGHYRGPSKLSEELRIRGIGLQEKQQLESFFQGGSYDKVFYNSNKEGNAIIAKTFIRVVP
ncbi:MAG: DUF4384 domain-containing protein [Planctomycetes bacterium]|nr:DUF4384 domain-containing protein [Planctomycetota bacterium]